MLTAIGGLAEFERDLIRSRTGEGRIRARDRGVKLGPKFMLWTLWKGAIQFTRETSMLRYRHVSRCSGCAPASILLEKSLRYALPASDGSRTLAKLSPCSLVVVDGTARRCDGR